MKFWEAHKHVYNMVGYMAYKLFIELNETKKININFTVPCNVPYLKHKYKHSLGYYLPIEC